MRWVLTVPAIWKQPAKQFMREAAYLVRMCTQSRGRWSGGPRAWPHTLIHPPPLGPQSHCVKTASPTLLAILEGCCHQERGWACRTREQRDKRHSPGQVKQCLRAGFLEAEPKMGILVHVVYCKDSQQKEE